MPGSLVDFDFDWDLKISGISRVSLRNHTEDSRLRLWTGVSVLFQILMVAKMLAYILINDNEVNMILADHVVLFGPNLLKIRIFYFLSFISGLLLLAALVEINDQRRHASWFRLYFEPLDSELNKYFSTKDWEEMKTELSKVIKFNHYSNLYFFWPLHSILYFWTLFKMDLPTRIAINGLCGVTNAISYYFFIRSIEYSQFLFLTMNIVFKYQLASIAKVLEGRQGFAEVDIRNLEKVVQLYKQHNDASAVINKLLGYNLAFGFLISTISLYIAFFDDLPLQSRIIFFSLVLASNSHMILFPHLSCITIHEPCRRVEQNLRRSALDPKVDPCMRFKLLDLSSLLASRPFGFKFFDVFRYSSHSFVSDTAFERLNRWRGARVKTKSSFRRASPS